MYALLMGSSCIIDAHMEEQNSSTLESMLCFPLAVELLAPRIVPDMLQVLCRYLLSGLVVTLLWECHSVPWIPFLPAFITSHALMSPFSSYQSYNLFDIL